jgi:hypothetical protein
MAIEFADRAVLAPAQRANAKAAAARQRQVIFELAGVLTNPGGLASRSERIVQHVACAAAAREAAATCSLRRFSPAPESGTSRPASVARDFRFELRVVPLEGRRTAALDSPAIPIRKGRVQFRY